MLKEFIDYKNELNLFAIGVGEYSSLHVTATRTGRIRNRLMAYWINNKMHWVKL